MKTVSSYSATAARLREGVRLHAARRHRFRLRPNKLAVLELEGVLFNLNSAVVMPSPSAGEKEEKDDDTLVRGLGILYVVYQICQQYPEKQLLIAGHTDTSGEPAHNLKLSEARAQNVLNLLMGRKRAWAEVCDEWHRVEDIQRLLKYYGVTWAGEEAVDPGSIDDKMGPKTRQATENFQISYNESRSTFGVGDAPAIAEDGVVGPQTWGAFFDFLVWHLAQMLGGNLTSQNLDQWRQHLQFVDTQRPAMGFGESFPIEKAYKDNYRSESNRRVEFLFFDAEDAPQLPTNPSKGSLFTRADCPFYDPSAYKPKFIEPEAFYRHSLELQTVNEQGHPVGNVKLRLQPLIGGEVEAESDENGYCRVEEELPPGRVLVRLEDGQAALMRMNGEIVQALVRTSPSLDPGEHSTSALTSVIVKASLTEEERSDRAWMREFYGPPPAEQGQRPSDETPTDTDTEKSPDEKPAFYAYDNLALAARSEGKDPRHEHLHEVVDTWLNDYHPVVRKRGFYFMVLDEEWLRCFNEEGEVAARFRPKAQVQGYFGAYATFITPGDPILRDMSTQTGALGGEEFTDENQDGIINLDELVRQEAVPALRDYVRHNLEEGRVLVFYHAPTEGEVGGLALHGGAGYLEEYAGEGSFREHIHQRNLAAASMVASAYESYIDDYIEDVKATESPEELQALGPPRHVYQFPRPLGATDDEALELYEANRASDFRAWEAIADHLNKLAGRRSPGLFLDCSLTFEAGVGKKFEKDAGPVEGNVEVYSKQEVKYNWVLAKNGVFEKSKRTHKLGVKGGVAGKEGTKLEDYEISGGVEHRFEVGSQKEKTVYTASVKAPIGGASGEMDDKGNWKAKVESIKHEIEINNKGDVKFTFKLFPKSKALYTPEGGYFVEMKPSEKVFGTGLEIDFAAWREKIHDDLKAQMPEPLQDDLAPWFEQMQRVNLPKKASVGLYFQGVREDTLLAYFSEAPGFFERKTVNTLLETGWNGLTHKERYHLRILGWDQASWDAKYRDADAHPATTEKPAKQLSAKQRVALAHLGIREDQWQKMWKSVARK